jgi:hypothetical protein
MRIRLRRFALGLALSTVAGASRADVIVSGTFDHLHIEASKASIVEVLEALKHKFGVVYQYRARSDWTVDGAFSGSLSSVLPRIFRDKDYAIKIDADNSVTVFVASPQGPRPDVPIPPPPVRAVMIGESPPSEPDSVAKRTGPPPK